jgi:hypothetical protein
MTRHLVAGLVIASLATLAPRPAAADGTPIIYDAVDALQLRNNNVIRVTGIISGQGAPTTTDYNLITNGIASPDYAARCDRLALLAMSKPGKFQFAVVPFGSGPGFLCELIVRTP